MTSVAYLPIVADRYGPLVRHLYVVGLDLTGVTMRAQIRFSGDSPGKPYVDLLTVTNGNAQGLRLVDVTTDAQGLPTSHVEIVINETTMEGLPYAGELGDAVQFAWDMQITLAGRKRRLAKGEFEITGDGVTGADAAPINRPIGYGRPVQPITSPWKAARLTFGEEQVTVQIVDAELVAPLALAAKTSADSAEADAALAGIAAASAQAVTRYFTTRAAGEAASVVDQAFATDDGAGNVIYYKRTAGGSTEIGRAVTPGALAAPTGAGLIGVGSRTLADKLGDIVSINDFPRFAVEMDDTGRLTRALNTAQTIYVPAGVTITVSDDPILRKGQSLVGDGFNSVLNMTSNGLAGNITVRLDDDCQVLNMKVAEVGTTGRTGVYGVISAFNRSNCRIDGVEICGGSSTGTMFVNCQDFTMSDCYVHDTMADGIHCQRGTRRLTVTNCRVTNVGDDGIAFVSHGYEIFGNVRDCVVSNCVVDGVGAVGSGVGIIGAIGISINGCRIKNTALAGIRISSASFGAEGSTVGGVISIVGNQISNSGLGNLGERGGIYIEGARFVSVKDNLIFRPATTGIALSNAWADIDIHDNKIVGAGEAGMFISSATQSDYYLQLWSHPELSDGYSAGFVSGHTLSVRDNTVRSAGGSGILVSGDPNHKIDGLSICDNEFTRLRTNAAAGNAYAVYVDNAMNVRTAGNRSFAPANPLIVTWFLNPATVSALPGAENTSVPRKTGFAPEAATWVGDVPHYRSTAVPTSSDAETYGSFLPRTVVWNDNPATGTAFWINTAETSASAPGAWFAVKF